MGGDTIIKLQLCSNCSISIEVDETRRWGLGQGYIQRLEGQGFQFQADYELFMGLDDDFSSCIFCIWEDIDVDDMGRKVQCYRPLKSRLV